MGNRKTTPLSEENEKVIAEWTANWNGIMNTLYRSNKKVLPVRRFIQTLTPEIVNALSEKIMYDHENVRLLITGYVKSKENDKSYQDINKMIALYIGKLYLFNLNLTEPKQENQISHEIAETFGLTSIGSDDDVNGDIDSDNRTKMDILMKSRALNILCELQNAGKINEKLVIKFGSAKKAITKLLNGNISEMGPFNNEQYVHLSDWWAEQMEEMLM